jgi:hypothetical protein
LMMEAACTSETSVDIQLRPWQYIAEDSELQVLYLSPFSTRILAENIDLNFHRKHLFCHVCIWLEILIF